MAKRKTTASKPETKAVKAAEVKEENVKAEAPAPAPVAAPKSEDKPAAKKTTAAAPKKPATPAVKKAAEKAETTEKKVVIQYSGKEISGAELVEKAKKHAGIESPKKIDVYVKPEVNKVYYVINGDVFGDFDLFVFE